MQSAHAAPRCTAKSKRTGKPCQAPAVRGWTVCRMHGAGGGAQSGPANPNWRHGGRSDEAVALRKLVNDLNLTARQLDTTLIQRKAGK
ncbi:HGGxSTG domain-containing protein [Rhodalgimonas zhirmunskyi]|uniref:HGGxSTG domain-containing protein n=1 Tax=Rhodalgimonas zhirmunskyi TaxID=2964767 RepID=UPI00352FF5F7